MWFFFERTFFGASWFLVLMWTHCFLGLLYSCILGISFHWTPGLVPLFSCIFPVSLVFRPCSVFFLKYFLHDRRIRGQLFESLHIWKCLYFAFILGLIVSLCRLLQKKVSLRALRVFLHHLPSSFAHIIANVCQEPCLFESFLRHPWNFLDFSLYFNVSDVAEGTRYA